LELVSSGEKLRSLMPLNRNYSHLVIVLLLLVCAVAFHVSLTAQQEESPDDDSKSTSAQGRRSFNSSCAGCHGLDGRGGDKAPNIVGSEKVQHLSDAQISSIISNGIPGTGMPPFHSLSEQQVRAVVSYVRTLQGKLDTGTAPGDAQRGKGIFFGKGECSTCHSVSGEGGFLGPDLSTYGPAMSVKAIRDEIVRPDRIARAGYRPGVVATLDGKRLEGIIRNEDNFSLQLQTKDGSFHFLQKTEVKSVEHPGNSIMPTNYGQRLSSGELDDLVSYLMGAGLDQGKADASRQKEEPSE
jgi:putative heme-binding domain-containing protein